MYYIVKTYFKTNKGKNVVDTSWIKAEYLKKELAYLKAAGFKRISKGKYAVDYENPDDREHKVIVTIENERR